ncbi:hypothetical protein [Actinomyces weissii]|uniref:Uncharacterized protein n=1 Tax=Actinomyces weissii TaxID=675090 RepID=A0A7T7M9E6_9ACTO|nr:hypothetical protein [Actinomyces weissii]QQM67297.1 hypothetical protein JG540_09940 [Actinomyces weissii]
MGRKEKLAKLQEKRDRLNAQIKAYWARQSVKARTRELIQLGVMIHSHLDLPLDEQTRTALSDALAERFEDGSTLETRLRDHLQRSD